MRSRFVVALVAIAFVAVAAAGCNSIFGFDHGTHSDYGLPCSDNTGTPSKSCDDDQLCMFKACEKTCVADAECPTGMRCLELSGPGSPGACVPVETNCDQGCPLTAPCAPDRVCRFQCSATLGCLRDQACVHGFCVGTDPAHELGAGDGAAPDSSSDSPSDSRLDSPSDSAVDAPIDAAPEGSSDAASDADADS
jgi:hypothetical protein